MKSRLDHRPIDKLDARLKDARRLHQDPTRNKSEKEDEKGGALGLAFRVGVELVSAVAVGLGIGLLVDNWLDTKPWFMLVFLILGGAAGILNVFRMARGYGYAVGYQDPSIDKQSAGGSQDETNTEQNKQDVGNDT